MENFPTVLLTVISGVLVYVGCEYIKEIWLEPFHEYKRLKGKVAFTLCFYANIIADPWFYTDDPIPDHYKNTANELRMLASELRAFAEIISWFRIKIPSKNVINDVSSQLIGLSNGLTTAYKSNNADIIRGYNKKSVEIIKEKLNIIQ